MEKKQQFLDRKTETKTVSRQKVWIVHVSEFRQNWSDNSYIILRFTGGTTTRMRLAKERQPFVDKDVQS